MNKAKNKYRKQRCSSRLAIWTLSCVGLLAVVTIGINIFLLKKYPGAFASWFDNAAVKLADKWNAPSIMYGRLMTTEDHCLSTKRNDVSLVKCKKNNGETLDADSWFLDPFATELFSGRLERDQKPDRLCGLIHQMKAPRRCLHADLEVPPKLTTVACDVLSPRLESAMWCWEPTDSNQKQGKLSLLGSISQPKSLCLEARPSLKFVECADADPSHWTLFVADASKVHSLLHDASFRRYDFNEYVSRARGIRQLPLTDLRSGLCSSETSSATRFYPAIASGEEAARLRAKTSVIICFVNEQWHALLRTIHSVLDAGPAFLIQEILLIDDGSDVYEMGKPLEEYIAKFLPEKVKLHRTGGRLGLIQARLIGARLAEAPILTFLDSHVEANEGWLTPLVSRIAHHPNRSVVVAPIITVIDQQQISQQFAMSHSNIAYGVFTWNLIYHWSYTGKQPPPGPKREDNVAPVASPTIAGGLFAVDREHFFRLGSYDEHMEGWGGENIEISFRMWQCGGSLEVIPCSVVGHIFRNVNPSPFPNSDVNTIFQSNLKRLAEVWMDDYKVLFYQLNHYALARPIPPEEIQARKDLRTKLNCKSFEWYLANVVPSMFAPLKRLVSSHSAISVGLEHEEKLVRYCLGYGNNDPHFSQRLRLEPCTAMSKQRFYVGVQGEIVPAHDSAEASSMCATAPDRPHNGARVTLEICSGHPPTLETQRWTVTKGHGEGADTLSVTVKGSRFCLSTEKGALRQSKLPGSIRVALFECSSDGSGGIWSFADRMLDEHSRPVNTRSWPLTQRVYKTVGPKQLDCTENMSSNSIAGWPHKTALKNLVAEATDSKLRGLLKQLVKGVPHLRTELEVCQVACDVTKDCFSFSFNPSVRDCWLKRKCGRPESLCESAEGYQTYFIDECKKR